MITIDNNLRSSSVDELWAVKLYFDDTTPITIERSANHFVFINSGGGLALLDLITPTSAKFRSFVNKRGRKYTIEIPNATAQQKSDVEGTYSISSSEKGNIIFDYPKLANTFNPFVTNKIIITPVNPYFPLSTTPYSEGDEHYDPVISKISSINDQIDIIKSKAKTSNFNFSFINSNTKEIGGNASAEGQRDEFRYLKYLAVADKDYKGTSCINKKCEVFSIASGQTSPTKIYHGRVSNISYSNGQINVSVNSEKPFSNKTIPSDVDANGILNTLAYGNYVNNTSALNYAQRKLFPINYAFSQDRYTKNYYTIPKNLVSYSSVVPHYYDKASQKYFPLQQAGFSNNIQETATDGEHHYSVVDSFYRKSVIIKANINSSGSSDSDASGIIEGSTTHPFMINSSIKNTYDAPTLTDTFTYGGMFAKVEYTGTSGISPDFFKPFAHLMGSINIVTGYSHKLVSNVDFKIIYGFIDIYYEKHPTETEEAYANSGGRINTKILLKDASNNSTKATLKTFSSSDFSTNNGYHTPATLTASVAKNTYLGTTTPSVAIELPSYSFNQSDGEDYKFYYTARIYDIQLSFQTEIDQTNEEQVERAVREVDKLYLGVDGIKRSWDTSNPCITPHEIHRDLLHRECGITATPDGWADLMTARSSFNARYYINEEKDLEKELDKMQEEGAFIFRYNALGNPSYLYVKDSYSASDVKATIGRNHISSISSSVTPFSDLITKIKLRYDRDPATGKLYNESTFEKTESRERYGLSIDQEASIDKSLDMIVDNTGVTALSNYYFNIASQTKSLVDVVVIEPAFLGLEIGDIIKFDINTLDEHIMGNNSNALLNKYYMIVKLNRSLGKGLKIQAREVYQS